MVESFYHSMINTDDVKSNYYNQLSPINNNSFIYKNGEIFKESKGWKFACYYLENLIAIELCPSIKKERILKNGEMNIPFGIRFIRELNNSISLMERQKIIDNFTSRVCKSRNYKNKTIRYETFNFYQTVDNQRYNTNWRNNNNNWRNNNINWRNNDINWQSNNVNYNSHINYQ